MSGLTSQTTIHLQARMYRKRFRGPETLEPLHYFSLVCNIISCCILRASLSSSSCRRQASLFSSSSRRGNVLSSRKISSFNYRVLSACSSFLLFSAHFIFSDKAFTRTESKEAICAGAVFSDVLLSPSDLFLVDSGVTRPFFASTS